MSRTPLGNVLMDSVKGVFLALLKLTAIMLAWSLKISGMILTKIGEAIEKAVTR